MRNYERGSSGSKGSIAKYCVYDSSRLHKILQITRGFHCSPLNLRESSEYYIVIEWGRGFGLGCPEMHCKQYSDHFNSVVTI